MLISRTIVQIVQSVEIPLLNQISLFPRSTANADPTERPIQPSGVVVHDDAAQHHHDHAAENCHHYDTSHPVRRATVGLAGVELASIRWYHDCA